MLHSMEASALPENVRGLRRIEFERLVELGVFRDIRVELLDGQLVEMSPQGDAHSTITGHLSHLLYAHLPPTMTIRQHSGFRAGDDSMPEPDIAVIPRLRGYHHPSDAFLVVEVADSSLHNDRNIKANIYAAASVHEYWIVNVKHEQIEVFSAPARGSYHNNQVYVRGHSIAPTALPGAVLDVSAIFDC